MINKIKAWYCHFRYGKLTSEIKAIDGGYPSEIAYYDKKGRTVGYFAYGYYDPNMQYTGQDWWGLK